MTTRYGGAVSEAVQYLLPTREEPTTRMYDLRVPPQDGPLRIGLLANGFPDTENYLARQVVELRQIFPDAEFRIETKGARHALSMVIPDALLNDMCSTCDAMVIAWGHCGSCTSGVTRDAIAFAEKGVPSVTLICEIFWEYSEWIAGALGMPNIPRIKIPYPTAGTGETRQLRIARGIVPEIVAAWGLDYEPAH